MTRPEAEIGVFGGSGFYSLLEGVTDVTLDTPFGPPSDQMAVGEIAGRSVAFLPRHGRRHQHPPHRIPYRANVWAMRELGVRNIVAPCAAGSLQPEVAPGDFVVCDQLVDRTSGRVHTFYDGPVTTHVSLAEPYDPALREIAVRAGADLGVSVHDGGTMVVIEGPRFATRAESRWYTAMGWSVINMTGYPEAGLARELEMGYVNISLITDYDVGLAGADGVRPVSTEEVARVFAQNNEKLRDLLFAMIPVLPAEAPPLSATALAHARFS